MIIGIFSNNSWFSWNWDVHFKTIGLKWGMHRILFVVLPFKIFFPIVLLVFWFYKIECDLKNNQNIQKSLLAKKRSLLHSMRDSVADRRKCDILFEEEKRMNFILKISINELQTKMSFICGEKKSVTE